MSMINTDDLPQGGVPTVFAERTLFPTPQPGQVDPGYGQKRGGSSAAIMMFLLMLIPTGVLGYFVWNLNGKLVSQVEETTGGQEERLNAQITTLETRIDGLEEEKQVLEGSIKLLDDGIGQLTKDYADKLEDIRILRARPGFATPIFPEALKTLPQDWDKEAKENLEAALADLEAYRIKVRDWPQPAPVPVPVPIPD